MLAAFANTCLLGAVSDRHLATFVYIAVAIVIDTVTDLRFREYLISAACKVAIPVTALSPFFASSHAFGVRVTDITFDFGSRSFATLEFPNVHSTDPMVSCVGDIKESVVSIEG